MNKDSPIGVFDSGIGGLTVLQRIMEALPKENTVYLGDTARSPYGSKSVETVLKKKSLARERGKGAPSFFVTDAPDRFIKVGQRFLGEKVESAVRIER